jgi:2-desacetyl-2-hydroxyethyl bacteriochlorophyllide A dehydrogenase
MSLPVFAARVRHKLRAHILDALDARGLVEGSRFEMPRPLLCELRRFEEAMPAAGEILVEAEATVVSPGTERAIFTARAGPGVQYPYVPGYSLVGRVIAAGRGSPLLVGQRVVTGGPHASLHLAVASRAVAVPSGVGAEHAAMARIGAIALQGVRKAAIEPGAAVIVFGAGLIGQLAAQLARCAGANVQVVATAPSRLEAARQCGLRTLDLSSGSLAGQESTADVVIEATGQARALNDALRAARPGGKVVLLGSTRVTTTAVDLPEWQGKGLSLVGAHVATLPTLDASSGSWTLQREIEVSLELARQRRLQLEPLLTRRASPDEAQAVYADLARPVDKSIGVLIEWSRPGPWRARVERVSPARVAASALRRAVGKPDAPAPRFQPPRRDGRRLRFGLIGCGEIAAESAAAIRASSNATISYAADPDLALAESLAAATGARAASSNDELLGSAEVDAVLVSTPHHLHAPLAIMAMEAGKHVVVEKPMATSVADCDRMIAAAGRAGVLLSVCYCHRFDPRVQRAKQLLEAGAIGELLGTRIVFGQYRGPDYWERGLSGRTVSDWRAHRATAGGGVLIMNACHLLDYVCWLAASEVLEVTAETAGFAAGIEVEDTVSMSYRYANGAIGTLEATTGLIGPAAFEQTLRGRDGQLVVAPALKLWSRRTTDGHEAERWHVIRELPRAAERRHFFEAFAAAVLDGGSPPVTAQDARAVQAVIEAAYLSADSKKTIMLSTLGTRTPSPLPAS